MNRPIYTNYDADLRDPTSFPFYDYSDDTISQISQETRLYNLLRSLSSDSNSLSNSVSVSEAPLQPLRNTFSNHYLSQFLNPNDMEAKYSKYSVHNSPLSLFPGASPINAEDERFYDQFYHLPNTTESSDPVIVNRSVPRIHQQNVRRNGSVISHNASIRSKNSIRRRNRTVPKSELKFTAARALDDSDPEHKSPNSKTKFKPTKSIYASPRFKFPVNRKTSLKQKSSLISRPNYKSSNQLNQFLDNFPEQILNFYPEKAKVYSFTKLFLANPQLNEMYHDSKFVDDNLIITDPEDVKTFNKQISAPIQGTFRRGPNGDLEFMEKISDKALEGYKVKDTASAKRLSNYERYRNSMISKKSRQIIPYEDLLEDIQLDENDLEPSEIMNTKLAWEILIRRILAAKIKYRLKSDNLNRFNSISSFSTSHSTNDTNDSDDDGNSSTNSSSPPNLSLDSSDSDQDSVDTDIVSSSRSEKFLLPPNLDDISPKSSVYSHHSRYSNTNINTKTDLKNNKSNKDARRVMIISPQISVKDSSESIYLDESDYDGDDANFSVSDSVTEIQPLIPQRHSGQSSPVHQPVEPLSKSLVLNENNTSSYSLHSIPRSESSTSSGDHTNQTNVRISYYSTEPTENEIESLNYNENFNPTATLPPIISITDSSKDNELEDLDKFKELPGELTYPFLKSINHSQINSNKFQNNDIRSMQGSISMVGTSSVITDISNKNKLKPAPLTKKFFKNDLYSLKSFDLSESDSESEQSDLHYSNTILSNSNLSYVSKESASKFRVRKLK